MKHQNNGNCAKCDSIIKDCSDELKAWFKAEQKADPELHACCGRRDKAGQDAELARGTSKAKFGESPHNYLPSRAIDVFFQVDGKALWAFQRYKALAKRKPSNIIWGGDWDNDGLSTDEKWIDSPHFQEVDWKKKVKGYPKGNE